MVLDLARLLIASLGAQCVGKKTPSLRLGTAIVAREHKRLAAAALGLVRVGLGEPQGLFGSILRARSSVDDAAGRSPCAT